MATYVMYEGNAVRLGFNICNVLYICAHVEIHMLMHINRHVDDLVGGCTKNE